MEMIRTYSGKNIDVFDLKPDDISILDICIGLSNIPRFAGQVDFFSVARHSIEVCNMLPDEFKLSGLLHDASEAYIGDMPTPIKVKLNDYQALESKIMRVVNKKFNTDCSHQRVKDADHASFIQEKTLLWSGKETERENTRKIRDEFIELFFRYANSEIKGANRKSVFSNSVLDWNSR